MDSFEQVVASVLQRQGFWTQPSAKVKLSKIEKVGIGCHSSSRWDLDVVERATWHARVVAVDKTTAFVTSANFTEWTQHRNVEAGVFVHNAGWRQLCHQFETLVPSRAVLEVPGFR